MTKEARIQNGEKTDSSTHGSWKTEQLHVLIKNEIRTPFNTIHKNKYNWNKDLIVRPDATELLEENIARTLSDTDYSNTFL